MNYDEMNENELLFYIHEQHPNENVIKAVSRLFMDIKELKQNIEGWKAVTGYNSPDDFINDDKNPTHGDCK